MVTAPREGITLADIQSQTTNTLASGATINEINKLRRQLDRIKGGGLVRATKAKVISLILSDVIGNSLETIASGLTVDPSLGERVQNIIVGDIDVTAQATQQQAITEGFDFEVLDLQLFRLAGEVCISGNCVGSCGPDETNCNGSCVNLRSEFYNCGACGNACVLGADLLPRSVSEHLLAVGEPR